MTLTDMPFRTMRRTLHLDREIYDDWIFPQDKAKIQWEKLQGSDNKYPLVKSRYVDELAGIVFAGFECREEKCI